MIAWPTCSRLSVAVVMAEIVCKALSSLANPSLQGLLTSHARRKCPLKLWVRMARSNETYFLQPLILLKVKEKLTAQKAKALRLKEAPFGVRKALS